jgi:hypothetical protein
MGENQSLKKADEWCCLLTIMPVLLWYAWRDNNNMIPNSAPLVSPNEIIKTTHSRNQKQLYSAALLLCVRVCLLATHSILLAQARLGQDFIAQFCRACLALRILLVINHHLSMHFFDMIWRYGPVYAWWLFAFERFNGMLEKVKHNGHDSGKMEVTLMRNWVQIQLIYELLLSLPDSAHEKERAMLECIIDTEGKQCGAMMTQIAIFRSEVDTGGLSATISFLTIDDLSVTDSVKLPKQLGKPINICLLQPEAGEGEVYGLMLSYF